MKNTTKLIGAVIIAIPLLYLISKKSNSTTGAVDASTTTNEVATTEVPESNEPTQIFGARLPDGTTATGSSNIASNPLDLVGDRFYGGMTERS